jgi:hypothetical protein
MIISIEIDTENTNAEEEAILAVIRRTEASDDDPATLEQLKAHRVHLEALLDRIEVIADDAIRHGAATWRRALGEVYELIQDAKKTPEEVPDADPATQVD